MSQTPSDAQAQLRAMAAATPDSPEDANFIQHLSSTLAARGGQQGRAGACSCPVPKVQTTNGASDQPTDTPRAQGNNPGRTQEHATDVGALCERVAALDVRKQVGWDGGCWLRADAICLAGLAEGLNVGKVWITGDVRDRKGIDWVFHVAAIYDGKVYDAGYDMNGVSLDEWQRAFSAETGSTHVQISSCAAMLSNNTLVEKTQYEPHSIDLICKKTGHFGGKAFYAQVSSWIELAADRTKGGLVPAGSRCQDLSSPFQATFNDLAMIRRPNFVQQSGLSASCQTKVFYKAMASLTDYRNFTFQEARVQQTADGAHIMTFEFKDPFLEPYRVSAFVSGTCAVRSLF